MIEVVRLPEMIMMRVDGNTLLRPRREDDPLPHDRHNRLTHQQELVLALVAEGYSYKEIAEKLDNSERTIKNHMSRIIAHTGARNGTHAVVQAVRLGWLAI